MAALTRRLRRSQQPAIIAQDEDNVSASASPSPDFTPNELHSTDTQTSVSSNGGDNDESSIKPLDLQSLDAKLTSVGRSKTSTAKTTAKASNPHGDLRDTYGNPFVVPDLSISEIRAAIPAHCYERSALRSLGYVTRDILQASANWILCRHVLSPMVPFAQHPILNVALWTTFTIVQGFIWTGLWVLAHECGHGAFSPSRRLNDTVGFILHSALGVPYFSWAITHGKHHKATGHMARDQVFVPVTRERYASRWGYMVHELAELGEETPIVTSLLLVFQQLFGFLGYLSMNLSGHYHHDQASAQNDATTTTATSLGDKTASGSTSLQKQKQRHNGPGGGINHFDPSSPIFDAKDRYYVLASDAGLLCLLAGLVTLYRTQGAFVFWVGYLVPYLWVNNWLVWITYLQHTDPTLPHYTPAAWTFARGAAATIDREFGFIGRYFMHGIIETHVLHHFVSTIPFYNADEASDAIRPVLGEHYRADTSDGPWGFLRALWRSARLCAWVEPSEGARGEIGRGVLFYRGRNTPGLSGKKVVTKEVHVNAAAGKKGWDDGVVLKPAAAIPA